MDSQEETKSDNPASEQTVANELQGRLAGKMQEIYRRLLKEKVGETLLVTADLVRTIAADLACKPGYIWEVLGRFEKRGMVTKSKVGIGQGIVLTFQSPPSRSVPRAKDSAKALSVDDLIRQSEEKIAALKREIDAETAFLSELKKRAQ